MANLLPQLEQNEEAQWSRCVFTNFAEVCEDLTGEDAAAAVGTHSVMAITFTCGMSKFNDHHKQKHTHGVLTLRICKKEAEPKLPEKKNTAIEG